MARVFKDRMIFYAAYDILLSMRMEVWLIIYIGSNWQRTNGQRFINLRELHAAAGCVGAKSITVGCTKRKLCALFENLLKINVWVTSFRCMG